ncbi:MAG: PAS domain S-box protein [Deltaproteobacteria bacterium]|nr:PAS domain S-box protein [Deltaproteobacteria bacterium]
MADHYRRFRVISEETRQVVDSPAERVLREGGAVADHTVLVSRDGREYPIADSGAPIRDGSGTVLGVVLVFHDMTAERAIERRLVQSEDRFRGLQESGIIGIIVADLTGNIVQANDAFLAMVGYTREDLAGGRVRWSEMTPPEFAARDAEALAQLAACGVASPWDKEYICKDGTRLPILVGAAMVEGSGECICFVLDQSERRRAKDELRRLNDVLERRVEERTAELSEVTLERAHRQIERHTALVAAIN